jgi:hypothetical protein
MVPPDKFVDAVIPPQQRQTCKACGRPDKFDFTLPDEVWAAVVPPELVNRVVCLFCFDEFAQAKQVPYRAVPARSLLGRGSRIVFLSHR